jgi:hypothetical protein
MKNSTTTNILIRREYYVWWDIALRFKVLISMVHLFDITYHVNIFLQISLNFDLEQALSTLGRQGLREASDAVNGRSDG